MFQLQHKILQEIKQQRIQQTQQERIQQERIQRTQQGHQTAQLFLLKSQPLIRLLLQHQFTTFLTTKHLMLSLL